MPITSKITLPLCRPREPAFVPKLNYRFDIPADHLVNYSQLIRFENFFTNSDFN